MKKQVKSVEQWREEIGRDAEGPRGKFMILKRAVFNSPAFAALRGDEVKVTLAVLNKLEYEKKGCKDRKGVKIGIPGLRNNGEFALTILELVARGLSKSTATRARERVWQLGFFDVIEPGTIHHAGKYRYSERWKHYPTGNYEPVGQQPPGKNVYPDNGFGATRNSEPGNFHESEENESSCYLKVVK